jgi:O-antigen/teichoic acid export membrane protein
VTLWRRILQGMTAFSLDTVISNVAAVLGAALVFRYLDLLSYGRLTLALSFYAMATVFFNFGLGDVFTAEIARSRGSGDLARVKFLLLRYLYLNIATGMLLFVAFVGVGMQRGDLLWPVMGTYLLTTALNETATVLFHSYTRYRRLAAQSITRSLARLALLVTLSWWWRGEPLLGVALTYPLMELPTLLVSLRLAQIVWPELRRVSTAAYSCKDLLALFQRQGLYATLSIPIKKVIDQLPIWFLKAMADDVALGSYAVAQRVLLLIFSFFRSLETTMFPLVSEQVEADRARLQAILRQIQRYSFWLALLTAIFGGIAAPWIIHLIAGPAYLMAVPLLRVMLWLLVLYTFSQSQRPLFYALKEQRWLFAIYLLHAILYSALLGTGVPLGGAMGAVLARLLVTFFVMSARLYVLSRVAPRMWISPWSVFTIETSDRRLWEEFKQRAKGVIAR